MQSGLSCTEKELDQLDAQFMQPGSDVVDNGTFCLNDEDDRVTVLDRAETKLKEYSTITSHSCSSSVRLET